MNGLVLWFAWLSHQVLLLRFVSPRSQRTSSRMSTTKRFSRAGGISSARLVRFRSSTPVRCLHQGGEIIAGILTEEDVVAESATDMTNPSEDNATSKHSCPEGDKNSEEVVEPNPYSVAVCRGFWWQDLSELEEPVD